MKKPPHDTQPDRVQTIDARGHRCPVPTLKLRRAIEAQAAGIVVLLADDPMAQIDVPHFCTQTGYGLDLVEKRDTYWAFHIRLRPAEAKCQDAI